MKKLNCTGIARQIAIIFGMAIYLSYSYAGEALSPPAMPTKINGLTVYCPSDSYTDKKYKKEKDCGHQNWHTSKADKPSGVWIYEWRNIYITAYDDGSVRFTFDDRRRGFGQKQGHYVVYVHLLDENYTVLNTIMIEDRYIAPDCNISDPNDFSNHVFKRASSARYKEIRHIVYTKEPHGTEFESC